mmetsp:Transcript_31489/g.83968  ORF Transcript_31489/g.83968 Transcript_31489/m.83968 type:complete len:252 (-) Transcript_31489:246-1001(-)
MCVCGRPRAILLAIAVAVCLSVSETVNSTTTAVQQIDNHTAPACDFGQQSNFVVGDSIHICVFLATSPPKKMVFRIKVDEHASLVLRDAAQFSASDDDGLHVWMSASGDEPMYPLDCEGSDSREHLVSCPQIFSMADSSVIVLSAVINMADGNIQNFVWDDSCVGCASSSCLYGSKRLDNRTFVGGDALHANGVCSKISCLSQDTDCDLKLFLTWAGTDADGNNALSASTRLSRFSGTSLTSALDSISSLF